MNKPGPSAEDMLAAMVGEHDQDLENAKQWWRDHDNLIKALVWTRMNEFCEDDTDEIVSRFAIIGFMTVLEATAKS